MEKAVVDVFDKYKGEISNIKYKLDQLEKGRIYELTGAKMDLAHINNLHITIDLCI